MDKITAVERNIRTLLTNSKYSVDVYQREYRWEARHVAALIDDLLSTFEESYRAHHQRSEVKGYGGYFLGPIIISQATDASYIVDGQQRLTSLTLILIALLHRIDEDEQQTQLRNLVFALQFGERSFNLNIPERDACMSALLEFGAYDASDESSSVQNVANRFEDVVSSLEDLSDTQVPFFSDWLIERVTLVEITATSNRDAFKIFETMNDRGLPLTATEMLKAFLLAGIDDQEQRANANDTWRRHTDALLRIGRSEDADAIRAWLRSQHALEGTGKSGDNDDFERIGSEFHTWVADNRPVLGLTASDDFARFIERDMKFFSKKYLRLRAVATTLDESLSAVKFLADLSFTLQYVALLAPLEIDEPAEVSKRKWRIVGAYLDIMLHRRIWNGRTTTHSALRGHVYDVARQIRGSAEEDLVEKLTGRLASESETFQSEPRFGLHGRNGKQIRAILARFADFIERGSGQRGRYDEYIKTGKRGYDIEHVLPEQPGDDFFGFDSEADYDGARNRIGGLLLLSRAANRSLQDMSYAEKQGAYLKENLVAASLHPACYEANPGFRRFIGSTGLRFSSMDSFGREQVEERQELCLALADEIWHPRRLQEEANR